MQVRCAITIGGTVQGVGFRPFVHALASQYHLSGFVRNRSGDVQIEVEGSVDAVERFSRDLLCRAPPLAQIERIAHQQIEISDECGFRIESSAKDRLSSVSISPDVATCAECFAELTNPADRRYRYPFLNCTNCGPRLTIVTGVPYDRARTTMADFRMCAACGKEYDDPANRRFHAQPIACPECGPRLQLVCSSGRPMESDDLVASFAQEIRSGKIGAMKGLGGYHLVCDAGNEAAVAELRRRKHRDEKPFAIMVGDVDAAEAICEANELERELLASWRSPIVLLRRRVDTWSRVARAVAPGNPYLGVTLPSTPLHHLLLRECHGGPLVATSGNQRDEPIAYTDSAARERLREIADLFLMHDRPIHVRCDDSVTRVVAGAELPVRRSRGYAPQPIPLPLRCPVPLLAVGGQLKGTFALGCDERAILSHHLGDLHHYDSYRCFKNDIALYEHLFDIHPECIAFDSHPDYASTRYALERSGARHSPSDETCSRLVAVQHHHAHMASCMAENGLFEPVIGVTFDGSGYGTDGAIWGGEFLVGDYANFRRAAHLRYVGLPGGERAVTEPWRMAVAHLNDAGCDTELLAARVSPVQTRTVQAMLARRLNTPMTSSVGRLFDAVAALIGLRDRVSYEGQAAMELEWLAAETPPQEPLPWELIEPLDAHPETDPLVVDTRPLIRAILTEIRNDTDRRTIARRFHSTIADLISTVCHRIRIQSGIGNVTLSGGVFLNAVLMEETVGRL